MDISWEKNSSIHTQIVFKKAERTINGKIGKSVREAGLTGPQFGVLDVLYVKGEMRICHLITKILATSGNMTVIIKNMERDGLIYRIKDPEDKRAYVVGLTNKGKELYESILPSHRLEIEAVYNILTPEEKSTLISILKKFKNLDNISEEEKICQKQLQ